MLNLCMLYLHYQNIQVHYWLYSPSAWESASVSKSLASATTSEPGLRLDDGDEGLNVISSPSLIFQIPKQVLSTVKTLSDVVCDQ